MRKALVFLLLLVFACGVSYGASRKKIRTKKMVIKVTSPAFAQGENIPSLYTCDGKQYSPPLDFSDVPAAAKSIALISDDPDAPVGTWVHWVLFNLPANTRSLPEHIPALETLPSGANQGVNSSGKIGYQGPCPPSGVHRYFFKVYALDISLTEKPGISKADLEKAMKGHILAQGELMGRYSRK